MKATTTSLFAAFLALNASCAPAFGEEVPNPGPRSIEAEKFLYDQAQEGIENNDIKAAIRNLEKLVTRYPQYERHPTSQELLTTLYLANGNARGAVKIAKDFLLVDSKSEIAQNIRGRLIEAYFLLGKNLEARTTAKELLAQSQTDSTKSRALYILAKVDAKEKKWSDARAKLDALPVPIPPEDKDSLLLEIGVNECLANNKAPTKKAKDTEEPWIAYFEAQNGCFKQLAAGQANQASGRAHPLWCKAFGDLQKQLKNRKLNKFQKDRLNDELKKTSGLAAPLDCAGDPNSEGKPTKLPESKKPHESEG
ncbi:MAG: outer membrane protein assembly factor BamD [Bdellovibrionales bacterium]|nr:outer membrane protein assembly factor BamD [Bdellovibrionales bacterium]